MADGQSAVEGGRAAQGRARTRTAAPALVGRAPAPSSAVTDLLGEAVAARWGAAEVHEDLKRLPKFRSISNICARCAMRSALRATVGARCVRARAVLVMQKRSTWNA